MKKTFGLSIFILFSLLAVPAFSQQTSILSGDLGGWGQEWADQFLANYVTTFYNTDSNAFPSNEANVVLQTQDGFLWFGGYAGLIRYDGRRYTQWDAVSNDTFTSSNVRSLYESKIGEYNGTLWIGTNDKGLFSFNNGIFTVYDKEAGTPSNMVRCITERSDGMVFCGTSDGLFYIDESGNINNVDLDIDIQPFIISIAADKRNNVFMILNTGELVVYTHNGRTLVFSFGSRFNCIGSISTNRILAGTQNGEVYITGFDGNEFNTPIIRETPNVNITSFYEDSNGAIWITSETGVGFLNTWLYYHHIGNPNGVGFYSSVIEDYQNGYWITATKGGVVKFSASAFTDFNKLYNFNTGSANAVLIDNEYTYIGTDSALFILDEDKKPVFTEFTKLINGRVRGIFRDSRGNIWVCTYTNMGAIRFNPETNEYKSFTTKDGLATDRSRSFAELPNGVIAIGTTAGVSFIKNNNVVSAQEAFGSSVPLNLPVITILSLCVTADGTLYIGTDGIGVYSVNSGGVTQFKEEDGLTGGVILRLLANPKTNGVWVSPSSGLCYIDENKTVHVINKVPPYAFLDILQWNNELVLLTVSLIIRADIDALLEPALPFEHTVVGRSSGLSASINANAWNLVIGNNELYFCCDNGINIYNFEKTLSTFIPYAGITRIDIDGVEYKDFSGDIFIPRDSNRLTIDLSYLSFGLLDSASMYYMLVGQDNKEHLMPKTGSLDVSYTNLRGGNYTFRVWTEDSGGNTGNIVEVKLQKEFKMLERAIVRVGFVVFGVLYMALIFVLIYRQRIRMHKAKQREYRTIISQALTAIANTIDAKDSYTSGHSMRVAAYSVEIARHMGMSRHFMENLYYIGLLHDVGKIGVPNEIINKPGKLSEEEYETMKQHTLIGLHILKDITLIQNLTAGAAEHHEHWDGNGYLRKLNGENISLEGRIIAIADTYDAMSSDRSYRKGLPKDTIIKEFIRCRGSQFDPEITTLMISLIEQDYFDNIDINKIIDIL